MVFVLAAVAAALVIGDVRSPLRAVVVAVFVLVAPGLLVLDAWGLARGPLGAALVLAVSTSLVTAGLLVQLYLGMWSTETSFVALVIGTSLGGLAVLLWRTLDAGLGSR